MDELYLGVLKAIGEDPSREGLLKTPARAARAMAECTRGYHQSVDEIINGALFTSDNDEMVVVTHIEFYSLCEHHLLPFFGHCHVGYIPDGRIVGLSKIARIVDAFSRRLQVQENLTQQIADALMTHLTPRGVGVVVEARHLCMMMRGVAKQRSLMTTSAMLGDFRNEPECRAEFLSLIARSG
ncbi:MAG: GTP cyclohydrolase I FolE [Myxococcales bacterium]|nr:GTP cyclohydrolase I FolE [Myxococcales bacterium]